MILLIAMAFLLTIAAFALSMNWAGTSVRIDEYDTLAQQMVYYHAAAARKCGTSCANGTIDPTTEISSFRTGQGAMAVNTVFRSMATDDYVVTYYTGTGAPAAALAEYNSGVLAALVEKRSWDTGIWLGSYDQATGGLDFRANSYWVDPETGIRQTTTNPDLGPLGLPAPEGAPVLVNRR